MKLTDAIKKRHSVRTYEARKVDKALIKEIVDCGRLAATARNEQLWEFIAVSSEETKERISYLAPNGSFIREAAWVIAVCAKEGKYYLEDCSAATENMLLASSALGLGACWVAGDKKPYCDDIKKLLNVPAEYKLVSMISLGYPAGKDEPHPKRKLDDVLHWKKFSS